VDEVFTRESLWGTYDGRRIPIKELEDSHVLNLIDFVERRVEKIEKSLKDAAGQEFVLEIRAEKLNKEKNILKVINEEVDFRKLDRSKVANGKRLPFKKEGVWMEWRKGERRPTPIPNSIDFIKPIGEE